MADIKLGRLPDRTSVKLAITITPDLQAALQAYAALYAETYGVEEPITLSGQSAPSPTLQ